MAISLAKLEANRRNATKSTGPRTGGGKTIVAKNALKHGLLAKQVILPDENKGDFEALRSGVFEQYAPVQAVETMLVNRLAYLLWRLLRVTRIETSIMAREEIAEQIHEAQNTIHQYTNPKLDFGAVCSDSQSEYEAAQAKLENLKARLNSHSAGLPFFRCTDSDIFTKLSRYETSLERSICRTIWLLEQNQVKS